MHAQVNAAQPDEQRPLLGVYMAAADFEPAPTPAPGAPRVRPKMIPGTFVILKFIR